jgi:hypothetical protein
MNGHRAMLAGLIKTLLLAALGCEPGNLSGTAGVVANGPPGPPPPPVENVATAAPAAAASAPAAASAAFAPASEPAPTSQVPAPPTAPAAEAATIPFVNLSAGIALPQLLPDGTRIGVSVDYSLRGNLKTSCRYFLVVASSAGETPLPVALDPRGGTIQVFLPAEVRPEHQPFRAQIDEVLPTGQRARVSNSAVLATSY